MKKTKTTQKPAVYKSSATNSKVEEPMVVFNKSIRALPALQDFTYTEFKKISANTPFTQAEWAAMLHVSERTLQRYAKSNGSFAAINAERALQLDKLIKRGKAVFGSIDKFYNWLKRNPYMLGGNLSLQSLTTADGIDRIFTQLGRIEQGLFA